jgi:hypothetical protein
MNNPSLLRMTALGLAFSSVALAQSSPPPPSPPAAGPPIVSAAPAASPQLPVVTQSSRVRAFNAGPTGEVRSLYLQNGSVVDVTPALGGQLGPAVRKGEKITVTGTKSEINGQSLVEAGSVRMNDQTFSANAAEIAASGPGAVAESGVPAPPGPPQALPATSKSRRKKKAAAPASGAVFADAPPPPDFGGPPPPPPDPMGPPPPPPDGMGAPPPPPDGMAPPPPPDGMAPLPPLD